jgi:hypothetical protein
MQQHGADAELEIAMNAKSMIRKELRNTLNTFKDNANRAKRDALVLKNHKDELIHVTDNLISYFGTNQTDLDKPRTYFYFNTTYDDRPKIHVSVRNASGFKDDSVSMAMLYLMTVGFETARTHDFAEALNREFTFSRADMDVVLDVYVKDDSPTCRKVAIGEETIRQVKYKIECD